jgi:AraC family transcriptional regulator
MWQFKKIEVRNIERKTLIGKSLEMSFANDRTGELWRSFMPQRKQIQNPVSTDLFSATIYPEDFNFQQPDINRSFKKWAATEVTQDQDLNGFETLTIPAGLYAVFSYKGSHKESAAVFGYIFNEWMPSNNFAPDTRPYFEVLGAAYKNDDPGSEEDIFISVRPK